MAVQIALTYFTGVQSSHPQPMHISQKSLRLANPRNVLRLAHFAGLTTSGRIMSDIIEELHLRLNYASLGF